MIQPEQTTRGDSTLLIAIGSYLPRTGQDSMNETDLNEGLQGAAIRRARDNSNRAIARRNLIGLGDSLGEDYVGVIGDGTFVA